MRPPIRVQRTRKTGQPGMPPGAVYVGRGTRYGNPWRIDYDRETREYVVSHETEDRIAGGFRDSESARWCATVMYRTYLGEHPELREAAVRELAGKDLACWCPLPAPGQPDHCHAAVLLEYANYNYPV